MQTVYELNDQEQSAVLELTQSSDSSSDVAIQADQVSIVNAAVKLIPAARERIPDFYELIRRLREDHTSPGRIILQRLPKARDPKTLIALIGSLLGMPTKYDGEGDFIIEIKEQSSNLGERPSFKNAKEFYLHTDLSYAPTPPRFLLMHSIANAQGDGGASLFCGIEDTLTQLSALDIEELRKPQFIFPAPPHYAGTREVQFSILTQNATSGAWRLRFRRDNLRVLSRSGIEALTQLIRAFDKVSEQVFLPTDSLILLDNATQLHGRTAFAGTVAPSSLGQQRHLNRLYVNL